MANIQKEKSTYKITCKITGKTTVIVRDYYNKKVEEYGSEERFEQLYICKQAKNMLKRGYSVQEIRDALGSTRDEEIPADVLTQMIDVKETDILSLSQPLEQVNKIVSPDVERFISKLKNYE